MPINNISRRRSGDSYVSRHWYGELSLPLSYWVNGAVITYGFYLLLNLIPWDSLTRTPKTLFIGVIVLWVVAAILAVWQLVGIWRSADYYLEEGRSKFWGNAAKAAVILGIIQTIGVYASVAIPQVTELAKIAIGKDPMGTYQLRVLRDASELEITGAIVFGLTDDVVRILDAHPTIHTVHLNSVGGRVGAARKLRDLIASRGLTTFTATGCSSACTLAYVAGRERLIAEHADLAFHQYSFPGSRPSDFKFEYEKDKQDWLARGISKAFADKAYATPNSEYWKPSHKELFEAGFLTGYAGPDTVAVSGTSVDEFDKFEAKILQIPWYVALKSYEPTMYEVILEELRTGLQKGRSITELQTKILPIANALVTKRLPYASDSTLRKFAKLNMEIMKFLYASNPDLCYQSLNLEGETSGLSYRQYLSEEMLDRELAIMAEIITSAAQQRNRPPNEQQVEKELTSVLTDLSQRYGDDLQMLNNLELARANKAKVCEITYDFFQTILLLPDQKAVPLLRYMFASDI